MIGKIVVGKSFKGCLAYCLNDKIEKQNQEVLMKDRAEVLVFNKCYGNEKELVQQFNEVRLLNPKLSKPVMHITLSLALGEILSKDKLMEMTEHCAKEFGFENNQYVGILHRDTNHQHLHIVANRIGFDKRTVSDSNSYKIVADYCRKMEVMYDLKQVLNPTKYLSKEKRNIPRFDERKELLRQHITQAIKGCYNLQQLEARMKERGYEIIKGRGISFADEKKVTFKGSQVNYSLQTIERILAQQRTIQDNRQAPKLSLKQENEGAKVVPLIDQKSREYILSKLVEDVMRPTETKDQVNQNLLPKKKKKKKRYRHL